ncbi:hypothetical protein BABINDRAFT_159062 [Babjeviella inositovora NRRL Y-12698]|uniref:O-acyltransferase n=1 Tax=Babjeviella inositovora NRRL Y-12698 TaxID=984486 RepID=A0A1E3QY02_9ASCO|nr:uncharacterized protein BABINDRAFT_159062 [Babjeviella inositovora NRRL Y-12698]ODQ82481.1 hypothetical protein BABINDRAFT_159062 [Babjeviella inositovora NRRL Y-12698]
MKHHQRTSSSQMINNLRIRNQNRKPLSDADLSAYSSDSLEDDKKLFDITDSSDPQKLSGTTSSSDEKSPLGPAEDSLQKMSQSEQKIVLDKSFKKLLQLEQSLHLRRNKEGSFRSRFHDGAMIPDDTTIFDKRSLKESNFYGFFVVFWLGVGLVMFDTVLKLYFEFGFSALFEAAVYSTLRRDVFKVGLTDLVMYLTMYLTYGVQKLVQWGYLDWGRAGWILQNVLQFSFLLFHNGVAMYLGYPWIAREFLLLHSLVMIMKTHSYAFYNGYLWGIQQELTASQQALAKDAMNESLSLEECRKRYEILTSSVEFCEFELLAQLPTTRFPQNITLNNFFHYTMFPTVVYSIEYPRTEKIRWKYVGEKLLAIFGLIFMMITLAESWMYPIVLRAMALKAVPFAEKVSSYPMLLLDMMAPFLLMYLLVWYLIWDAILNCIAELTRFGNRNFYNAWWNSTDWSEFARDWNVPVHKFLLRHVYHSSILALKLNRLQATIVTFLLSSLLHESTMFVIFHKFRGYLLLLQMSQLPLVALSRTRWLRDRKVLGNVVFWIGIATGPSLMCTLYLTF